MAAYQSQACPEQDCDFYATLGVAPSASNALIRSRFKYQALLCHPDKVPDEEREVATQRCQSLLKAYQVLCNEAARRRYDHARAARTQDASQRRFDNDHAARAQTKVSKPNLHFIKKHCSGCNAFCLPVDMRKCRNCPTAAAGFASLICASCETCAACVCAENDCAASPAKRRRAFGEGRSALSAELRGWAEKLGEASDGVDRFAGHGVRKVSRAEQGHDQELVQATLQKAELPTTSGNADWIESLMANSSSNWTGIADMRSAMTWNMFPDFWKK